MHLLWDVDDIMSSRVLGRLSKFMHGVLSRGPRNVLSSRTSGHKDCRVDKEYFREEKCIALGRVRALKQIVVLGAQAISCRVVRVVGVDTSTVELTKNILEWRNESH